MLERYLGCFALVGAVSITFAACTAGNKGSELNGEEEGPTTGTAGMGGMIDLSGSGASGGMGGTNINPCGSECGEEEICDTPGVAKDENCDGQVDENCSCVSGTTHPCFKGDGSYLNSEGCFAGTQTCSELGLWSECVGGVHATDNCYMGTAIGCHPIDTRPGVTADLMDGTGNQSNGGTTHTFAVTCPGGVSPCPTPSGTSYTALQSGEYTVEYTKDGNVECTFPLFVDAPGLRVEVTWNWPSGQTSTDVDLHLHRPNDTTGWTNIGDCYYANCAVWNSPFNDPSYDPAWFTGTAPPDPPPPMPVAWTLDPVVTENNTCYYFPTFPSQWATNGLGCHNPRLDLDNIYCDPAIAGDCTPENINVDAPPAMQWFRVGVHYYSSHGVGYDVFPDVKIFCDGSPAAQLGSVGFAQPTVFHPADSSTRFWLVADVLFFPADECNTGGCVVQPLYGDVGMTQPLYTDRTTASASFAPAYPPIPPMP